jgi:hypothetical protein
VFFRVELVVDMAGVRDECPLSFQGAGEVGSSVCILCWPRSVFRIAHFFLRPTHCQ